MVVCDICKKPTKNSKISIDTYTIKERIAEHTSVYSIPLHFSFDICPRCINKILKENGMNPLFEELEEKENANG